jgi:hypothetical protein
MDASPIILTCPRSEPEPMLANHLRANGAAQTKLMISAKPNHIRMVL